MHFLTNTYPSVIEPHYTWEVLDSSKLSTYQDCPRKFFYEYLLGWRIDQPNIHLEFGIAWHLAMEYLLKHKTGSGYTPESKTEAMALFLRYYHTQFPIDGDEDRFPKNAGNALVALTEYIKTYSQDDFTVLYTEVAGSVPVTDDVFLHFKIDAICEDERGVFNLDHKTSLRDSQSWAGQWYLSLQVGVYTHALYCLYPPEQVYGMIINGVFLKKGPNTFKRVTVSKQPADMEVFMWNMQTLLSMLSWNMENLSTSKEGDTVLCAFPMNTGSCTKYGACPYHAFCCAWPNPLQRCASPPPGFIVERWDPRKKSEEKANYTVEDGKICAKNLKTGEKPNEIQMDI